MTRITVYDILGKEVMEIVNEKLQPGIYEIDFDGGDLPSGAYFYTIRTNEFTQTRKMVLIK
jgi:hypothetical protein